MIKTLYVHAGEFHADDVMCAALVEFAFNARTIRINNVLPEYENDESIIADIGYGKYDHHQLCSEHRENGMPYAACGLVFRDIWQHIFTDEYFASRFDIQYIRPIELQDNGIDQNPLSLAIKSFNPAANSNSENLEACFRKAVDFMKSIIRNEVERARTQKTAFDQMMQNFELGDKHVVILDKYIPGIERLIPTSAEFIVFPSNRGGWNLQAVPKMLGKFGNKVDLPDTWLQTKPQGCSFVHKNLFLAAFDTKENARNALTESGLIDY